MMRTMLVALFRRAAFGLAFCSLAVSAGVAPPTTAVVADYAGWTNAYRVANDRVALLAVPSVARVLEFGAAGGTNLLWQNRELLGKPADLVQGNQAFGGAKLWVAPQSEWHSIWEVWPPCPFLDAGPCVCSVPGPGALTMKGHEGSRHGVRFDRTIRLPEGRPCAELDYTMTATGDKPVKWGLWSVIQLRPGGRILAPTADGDRAWLGPQPDTGCWSRVEGVWEMPHHGETSKLYANSSLGWVAYVLDDTVFVLTFPPEPAATFPKGDASLEAYTGKDFIELEHISPLHELAPGGQARMRETWFALPAPTGAAAMSAADLRSWIQTRAAIAARTRSSMKGWELYAWQDQGKAVYALLAGTNRLKTQDEIAHAAVTDLDEIERQLDTLMPGQTVIVWGRVLGEAAPAEAGKAVAAYGKQINLIIRGQR